VDFLLDIEMEKCVARCKNWSTLILKKGVRSQKLGTRLIMWVAAMRTHGMMALTFTLLVIGFILLDLAHFGFPGLTVVAGYELMACALCALYMMAAIIYQQVFGREILPLGKPWIRLEPKNSEDEVVGDLATDAA
jgi:hypothetical protein